MTDLIPLPSVSYQRVLPFGLEVDLNSSLRNFWKPFFEKKSIMFMIQSIEEHITSECPKCKYIHIVNCLNCFQSMERLFETMRIDLRMACIVEVNLKTIEKHREKRTLESHCAVSLFSDGKKHLWGNIEFLSVEGKKIFYNLLEKRKFTFSTRHHNGVLIYFTNCSEMNELLNRDENFNDIKTALKLFYFCCRVGLEVGGIRYSSNLRFFLLKIIEKSGPQKEESALNILSKRLEKIYTEHQGDNAKVEIFLDIFTEFIVNVYRK